MWIITAKKLFPLFHKIYFLLKYRQLRFNMARKKSKNKKRIKIWTPNLEERTRKIIVGIICLGIAIILLLSFFGGAGIAGYYIKKSFQYMFGWLYFLSPIIFISAGAIFISSLRQKIYGSTLFGLLLFTFGALGISDIIKSTSAGFFGRIAGAIEKVLSFWGGIVFEIMIAIIGLIIIFEFSLKFKKKKKSSQYPVDEYDEDDELDEEGEEEIEEEEVKEEPKKEKNIISKLTGKNKDKMDKEDIQPKKVSANILANWNFPSLDLLESDSEKPTSGDIKTNSQIIRRTLSNFNIPVEMDEINIGPTVTRYTLKPAEGVKLSKIISLQNDLSLALAAHPIRIEAPIPGKSLVGIEVPNKSKAQVRLRNLLSLNQFSETGLLSVPLGRDVSGQPVYMDIAKMPHLLVAGSTGSGKSVAIHTILSSLLFKNTPETLRILLIDPKRVELTTYNNLPYLVSDVITKPKKAIMALKWAVLEMEKRYEELEEAKSRDIDSFNKKMLKEKKDIMPYILVVIDELADLMASYGREVEGSIVRLAQMARATGIHLIVSTQRPSTEVITGLIKANISARIALRVASQIDSRTILDNSGAEKLLGQGDLLFQAAESSKPKRIQGVFVSEDEISRVVKYIIENNEDYISENEEIEDFQEVAETNNRLNNSQIDFDSVPGLDDEDDLYPEAYKVVVEAQKASSSLLQRRLRIGYARAARLIDMLEERGVIGQGEGAKPREVLVATPSSANIDDDIPEDVSESMPRDNIGGVEGEEISDEEEDEEG